MVKRQILINDRSYEMLLPAVIPAVKLSIEVAALIGPVLPALAQLKTSGAQVNLQSITDAIRNVVVDAEKLNRAMRQAVELAHVHCDGKAVFSDNDFERHFGQHRGDVFQVSFWALWECVKDFFPVLDPIIQSGAKEMQSQFQKAGL